jgi:hypothetical protein
MKYTPKKTADENKIVVLEGDIHSLLPKCHESSKRKEKGASAARAS